MKKISKKKIFRSLKKDDNAVISFFLIFVFMGAILLFLGAVAIPMMLEINTAFYGMGEDILEDNQEYIDAINDAGVRQELNNITEAAQDSITENQNILGSMFQYWWIFVLIIIGFITFIKARRMVETSGGII